LIQPAIFSSDFRVAWAIWSAGSCVPSMRPADENAEKGGLIGVLVMNDRFGAVRAIGAFLMTGGIVLLSLL
jgi:hypothetical protein